MTTAIFLREQAVDALASRLRRASGRSFSRAAPTVDASITLASGRRLRVAGVSEPVSPGLSFAFREQDRDAFTLPRLIANDTVPPAVAALLSGGRAERSGIGRRDPGCRKDDAVGALLFELPGSVRTVIIEDTRELPIPQLQALDRDVQGLRTGTREGPELTPTEALRTALRLGDGALIIGEIRGREATVLYEAMRVGANANAVLGTIHGDGALDVHERVTADLDVPPSSFGATDLIVTVQIHRDSGDVQRRVARVEEVFMRDGTVAFEPLFDLNADGIATATGRIDRGESHLLSTLTRPSETYSAVRDRLADRRAKLAELARDGLVRPMNGDSGGDSSPPRVAGPIGACRCEPE
ncbi:MAG: ATPase, T2SS/T4P/T4SS family [Natrialbaceae archaeon]|nr:ATPase, T2SS/T4P/T4SS family [Natrialbaceae archaeon]